jgi:hypothetical protein
MRHWSGVFVLVLGALFSPLAAMAQESVTLPVLNQAPPQGEQVEVTITVVVPPGTGPVFITGNEPELGPWNPRGRQMEGSGSERTIRLRVSARGLFEYKFTLGSWNREALLANGAPPPNNVLRPEQGASARVVVARFGGGDGGEARRNTAAALADVAGAGVQGTLIHWRDVRSRHLRPTRNVSVWLPPGYAENPDKRYRVLYMSDGQNVFDPRLASFGTDWGMDEAMVAGMQAGRFEPAIIVAAWSSERRFEEYSPWHGAPAYARFLIEELMPRVNREFRTLTGPAYTFHMGSSMGGLLSFYLVRNHPEVFSACGCVSTHFALSPADAFAAGDRRADRANRRPFVEQDFATGVRVPAGQRMFFTHGTLGLDAGYSPGHSVVGFWLRQQGMASGRDFRIKVYEGGDHNEASWRAQAGEQLDWLLGARP